MRVVVNVPGLKTKSLNHREHHYTRARRVSAERLATAAAEPRCPYKPRPTWGG